MIYATNSLQFDGQAGEEMGYQVGDMNGDGQDGIFAPTPVTLRKVQKNLDILSLSLSLSLISIGNYRERYKTCAN